MSDKTNPSDLLDNRKLKKSWIVFVCQILRPFSCQIALFWDNQGITLNIILLGNSYLKVVQGLYLCWVCDFVKFICFWWFEMSWFHWQREGLYKGVCCKWISFLLGLCAAPRLIEWGRIQCPRACFLFSTFILIFDMVLNWHSKE